MGVSLLFCMHLYVLSHGQCMHSASRSMGVSLLFCVHLYVLSHGQCMHSASRSMGVSLLFCVHWHVLSHGQCMGSACTVRSRSMGVLQCFKDKINSVLYRKITN